MARQARRSRTISNPRIHTMREEKEQKQVKSESTSLKFLLRKLFLKSDIHGWSDFYEASKTREKIFWSLLILTATGIMVYELVLVCIDYRDNPILTTYGLISDPAKISFPEIYLCPSNPIHWKTWKKANVDKKWERNNTKGILKTHSDGNGLTGILAQKATISESMGYLYKYGYEIILPPPVSGNNKTTPTYTPWIPEDVQEYFIRVGYPTQIFLKECAFNSKSFTCERVVEPVFDGNFGKCFLLKTGNFKQSVAGLGLSLVINLDFENGYPKGDFDSPMYDGVVMKINTELDIASQKNILLYPGTYTKIAIEAMKMNLIQKDQKEGGQVCVTDKESKNITKVLKGPYSPGLCQLDCAYSVVFNSCDCNIAIDKKFLQNHTKFCDPEELKSCAYPAISSKAIEINECSHKCHTPCNVWKYTVDSSMARFPSDHMAKFEFDNVYDLNPGRDDRGKKEKTKEAKKLVKKWTRGDYIILDVAFSSLQYVEVTQRPSMTVNTLISNIGGQCGLWIGASIVTLIKCVVFLTPVCCILCKKRETVTTQNGS